MGRNVAGPRILLPRAVQTRKRDHTQAAGGRRLRRNPHPHPHPAYECPSCWSHRASWAWPPWGHAPNLLPAPWGGFSAVRTVSKQRWQRGPQGQTEKTTCGHDQESTDPSPLLSA